MLPTPIEILLVEDNQGDVRLVREALQEEKVLNRLHAVSDGVKALAFLRQEGVFAHMPRPDLILLDLNLPRKDGREVLTEIKSDLVLRDIPVVILTSSTAEQDLLRAYRLDVCCYLIKPVDLHQLIAAVQTVQDLWLTVIKTPA